MFGAQRLLSYLECPFVEGLGCRMLALGIVEEGQIVQGCGDVGVIGAQRLLSYLERSFVEGFGLRILALGIQEG